MKDIYGDKIEVTTSRYAPDVIVRFTVDGKQTGMYLTAKKTRKLIRKLQREVSAIEIAQMGRVA